jgi:hypothetical protein
MKVDALLIREVPVQAILIRINNGFSFVTARFGYASATIWSRRGYQLSFEEIATSQVGIPAGDANPWRRAVGRQYLDVFGFFQPR